MLNRPLVAVLWVLPANGEELRSDAFCFVQNLNVWLQTFLDRSWRKIDRKRRCYSVCASL